MLQSGERATIKQIEMRLVTLVSNVEMRTKHLSNVLDESSYEWRKHLQQLLQNSMKENGCQITHEE
jgi:hypothetical protein